MKPDELLRLALVGALHHEPAHGYILAKRMAGLGLIPSLTTGRVYRTLRAMGDDGLVVGYWDTSDHGPAQRVYHLTVDGERYAASGRLGLRQHLRALRRVLASLPEVAQ